MLAGRISAGNTLHLAKFIRTGHWEAAETWLRRVADEARALDCDRVLLSSEWLLEALAPDGQMAELTQRLKQMDGYSVEFLLVLREPVGQLISLYKHRAKRGTTGSIDSWVEHGYDLPRRLSGIRRQVEAGGIPLVVRGYGKENGALESLFFKDWLGLPVPVGSSNLRVNPSLSLSELVLLRKLNARHPGLVPYLYDRLLAIPLDKKLEGSEMIDHARQVAIQTVARHADEWAHWNEMLPPAERFALPEPGPQPGPEPDALELSAEQLAVVMQLLGDALGLRLRMQVLWSWRVRPLLANIKRVLFPGFPGRRGMPRSGLTNTARFPVALPETGSERRLAEAAARPLPVIGATARILLLCARESLDEEQAELIRSLCRQVEDWGMFIRQAEFRLIVPLVYRHLSTLDESAIPEAAMAELKARSRSTTIRNLAMTAIHHRLVRDILEPLQVPYLFFKGPSLAYRYYREPGLRQFRDIDLLIPRRHMIRVGQRLRESGFRPYEHPAWGTDDGLRFLQRFSGMMNWISPEGVLVEIPSSLDADWDRLPTDELIEQAETVEVGGLTVPVPKTADFICYLFKHHSRHHWARLHWIADLNAILDHPGTDLPAILDRARSRGFERTVKAAIAIHQAVALREPWNASFEDPFAHELFRHCLTNLEGNFEQELALRETFPATSIDIDLKRRQRRHWLERNLLRFGPRSEDFLQRPLPARWHFIYYLIRPFLYLSR